MTKKIVFILLVMTIVTINSCESRKAAPAGSTDILHEIDLLTEEEAEEIPVIIEPTRAELVMRAIMNGYPNRIVKIEYRYDDWAVFLIDAGENPASVNPAGKWYYYTGGRLLPEDKKDETSSYRSLQLYNYPGELPVLVERNADERERLSSMADRRPSAIARSTFFLDDLFAAATRAEVEKSIVRMNFLGGSIRVHKDIQEALTLVEARIRAAAATDRDVQTWINNLGTWEGWNWRNVANSDARSYHAYGLAIDLLPRSLGGLQTYWLWTAEHRNDWYNVPYSQRYHPPQAVVAAFESYGFIWGGKWTTFDTMHFEYRPEILFLSGLDVQVLR